MSQSIYKDALVIALSRAGIPFSLEKNYEITYKGVILPSLLLPDFVVWDKILFEAAAKTGITRMTTKLCKDAYGQSLSVNW